MTKSLLALLFPIVAFSQGYTSYFTGNSVNIDPTPRFGICMMGGATEHDSAMKWLLQKANGGDVVVLRSSGSDGYNDYLYSELGVEVNSVETLVITSVAGAENPYVLDKVAHAEMIWFAGGDQFDYVSYFRDSALGDLLNDFINVKHGPIGGTSAGMAILGGKYFSAQNGSVTSAQALANPYRANMTLGVDDFLHIPFMENVITDTHYDNPDRRGRQTAFLARFKTDLGIDVNGIACNEYVAVCIGSDGIAHVYGDYPNYQEFAYFIQPDCSSENAVETCTPNTPLTWNFDGHALKVYKVPGTMNGANYFDINNWKDARGSGGNWENWSANNGVFTAIAGSAPQCLLKTENFNSSKVDLLPNPFENELQVNVSDRANISIFDIQGRMVYTANLSVRTTINTTAFAKGLYVAKIETNGKTSVKKLLKK
ncbi:hypothetical protein FNO01nite_15530 [Flavobacterium noncentrifugens]|uniref:Por secretion system C-terminal sorting domain-containing protein n=1 Tax=Flavobacterium noncentrifugens TaxID=1128970 RepID=A0A1G8WE18_9FLAO|nr:T9SS type A sorting domain-containing protein [Flavobacterium noncentrifugens]GEP50881.1 hypothetical protein FNO01nite_15530 [Flavobacterium noncentrifugens]SDJ76376.1 Por secretion system C-terminal sorting domain-containing protein [Flavobacterium noncentrifugens]